MTGGSNESGFSARPGGICDPLSTFSYIGRLGYFWTSSEVNDAEAFYIILSDSKAGIKRGGKGFGASARCIKRVD